MDMDVYKAPEANLMEEEEVMHTYYVVAPGKYLLLNISTLGMYSIYWFYRHWAQYKLATEGKIWPIPRAIFSIFFTHSLFGHINKSLEEKESGYKWAPAVLATLYVVAEITSNITDRLSEKEIGSPYTDLISLLCLPLIVWVLYRAQLAANIACDDPSGDSNSAITVWNFLWIFIGLALWGLIAFGFYVMAGGNI